MTQCKNINCFECKWYWPHNSIMTMQTYCYNQKRIFEPSVNGKNLVRK